jgi:hypothetical protein
VRVEDESAAPVAGVNVDVTCEDLYRFGQVTDPSGTIEIESDSPPRLVDVSTSFQGSDWAIPPVRTIGPDEREVVMVLHRAGHITGRLVDPDGHPVPQAILEVLADGRPFAQGSNFSPNQVWTNPQGRFRIQVPFHASVSLVAVERVQPDRTVWAGRLDGLEAGAENVELRLAPVASDRTLDVRVLRPDGTPAKDVQVYARVRATNVEGANVRTDAQGRAHLTGLPAARIGVHARPTPETVGAAAWLEAYAAEVEPAGQEVILRFEEAILLRGRVVDTAGRPVAGASVGAIRDWDRPLTFVETDEDGRFTFRLSAKQLEGLYLTASLHDRHVRLPALDPDAGEQVLTLPD